MQVARRRVSASMVVAVIALVMAMGSSAWALVVTSAMIKDKTIRGKDIKSAQIDARTLKGNAVSSTKIAAGGVAYSDLADDASTLFFGESQTFGDLDAIYVNIGQIRLREPGTYVVFAQADIKPLVSTSTVDCRIWNSTDNTQVGQPVQGIIATNERHQLSAMGLTVIGTTPKMIQYQCRDNGTDASAYSIRNYAIKVSSAQVGPA